MKKLFLIMIIFSSITIHASLNDPFLGAQEFSFMSNEHTFTTGSIFGFSGAFEMNTPVLSLMPQRQDIYTIPSIAAFLGKGEFFTENKNFTYSLPDNVGVIIPIDGRSLFTHIFFGQDNSFSTPIDILSALDAGSGIITGTNDPTDNNYVPRPGLFAGLGFSYELSSSLFVGANIKYSLDYQWEKQTSDSANASSTQISNHNTNRVELTPSLTLKMSKMHLDAGLLLSYQWIDNTVRATTQNSVTNHKFPFDYSGNLEAALYSRFLYEFNYTTKVSGSVSLGYLPSSTNLYTTDLQNQKVKVGDSDLDALSLAARVGLILTPITKLTLKTGLGYIYGFGSVEMTSENAMGKSVSTTHDNSSMILLTQSVKFQLKDWIAFTGGVAKIFTIQDDTSTGKVTPSGGTSTRTYAGTQLTGSGFVQHIGMSFDYENFNLSTIINFDLFTQGPYIITGDSTNTFNMASVTNLSYKW